jgi:protein-disulfide isomerase
MQKQLAVITAFCLFVGALSVQNVPIPDRPEGVSVIGSPNARFHLEAFYDLTCPGSRDSFFTLKPILANLTRNANFRFTIHLFPLPYHLNSYTTIRGAKFFERTSPLNITLEYIDLVFRNQESFYNEATLNLTLPQIQNRLADLVVKDFNGSAAVNRTTFINALNNDTLDSLTRVSWKYGCQRSVTGTPTYLANNIFIDDAFEFTSAEWVQFINQYV